MNKRLFAATLLSMSLAVPVAALAHGGAAARHGGVVATASDLSFELVAQADGAAIFVEDHGKPMPPAGMSGKVTALQGGAKSEATLVVAGDRLQAPGLKLLAGARVVAVLTTAAGKVVTVRFVVK